MRYAVVVLALALMIMMAPAMAADFQVSDDEFAKALLNNTIANLRISLQFLDILNKANGTAHLKFQNIWGIVYGGVVVSGINNDVVRLVLGEIAGNKTLYNMTGDAINYLGQNSSVVFGDSAGSKGLAKIVKAQVDVLNSNNVILKNYADALTNTIHNGVVFFIKLAKAIPAAFT